MRFHNSNFEQILSIVIIPRVLSFGFKVGFSSGKNFAFSDKLDTEAVACPIPRLTQPPTGRGSGEEDGAVEVAPLVAGGRVWDGEDAKAKGGGWVFGCQGGDHLKCWVCWVGGLLGRWFVVVGWVC